MGRRILALALGRGYFNLHCFFGDFAQMIVDLVLVSQ